MRGGINSRGYTIVEVMIFMAISGLMFVMAANFINGKQGKVEVKQGVAALNADVSSLINQVSDGRFPSTAGFSCSAPSNSGMPIVNHVASGQQGANLGCVFMGKIIEFGATGMTIHVIAGRQYALNDAGVLGAPTNFAKSEPNSIDTLNQTDTYKYGIKLLKVRSNSSTTINALGLFTGFGSYDNAAGTDALYQAGSGVITVPFTSMPADGAGAIYDTNVVTNPDIIACFDGGNGQFATLTIGAGGGGQRLATKAQIYNTRDEAIAATSASGVCS